MPALGLTRVNGALYGFQRKCEVFPQLIGVCRIMPKKVQKVVLTI